MDLYQKEENFKQSIGGWLWANEAKKVQKTSNMKHTKIHGVLNEDENSEGEECLCLPYHQESSSC